MIGTNEAVSGPHVGTFGYAAASALQSFVSVTEPRWTGNDLDGPRVLYRTLGVTRTRAGKGKPLWKCVR